MVIYNNMFNSKTNSCQLIKRTNGNDGLWSRTRLIKNELYGCHRVEKINETKQRGQ